MEDKPILDVTHSQRIQGVTLSESSCSAPPVLKLVAVRDLKINKRLKALVPRPTEQEYEALKARIAEEGFKDPIVVRERDLLLIDGFTRIEIAIELGIEVVPVMFDSSITDDELPGAVIGRAAARRHLRPFARVRLAATLLDAERERATERMKAGRKLADPGDTCPEGKDARRTREVLARQVGLGSGKTLDRGFRLLKEASAELLEDLNEGRLTIGAAYGEAFGSDTEDMSPTAISKTSASTEPDSEPPARRDQAGDRRGKRADAPDRVDGDARVDAHAADQHDAPQAAAQQQEPHASWTEERRAAVRRIRSKLERLNERIAGIIEAERFTKDDDAFVTMLDHALTQIEARSPKPSALDAVLAEPDSESRPARVRKKRPRPIGGRLGADYC